MDRRRHGARTRGGRTGPRGRLLFAGVLTAVLAAAGSGSAYAASGPVDTPDVALVVPGGTGVATAVQKGQPGFERLWRLLDPAYTGSQPVPVEWARGRLPAVRITVVWGLTGVGGWPQTRRAPGGDVAIEREDQVFLAADGTPWVRSDPAPDVADDDIRWHRAAVADYEAVRRAGLLGTDAPVGSGARGGTGDALRWGLAGLLAGGALGAGGAWYARRAADRSRDGDRPPRGPRQELIG